MKESCLNFRGSNITKLVEEFEKLDIIKADD